MITIDGGAKSGSGTIVRYSAALAALLGEALHLTNIRARRDKPGLRPQHLQCLRALVDACGGRLEGAGVGSSEVTFSPGEEARYLAGPFAWDIGSAGSATMLAMTLLHIGLFNGKGLDFVVTGGLFQDFAPSALHMQRALLPTLEKMGGHVELVMDRPGYVPRGAGIIRVKVKALTVPLSPLQLPVQGKARNIEGVALSSHLRDQQVSHRMAEACSKVLHQAGYSSQIEIAYDDTALQAGAALAAFARTDTGCILGSDRAGAPGRRSESIGRYVASNLLGDLAAGATVDRFLADQVIIFAALAEGKSEFVIPQITEHVDTNLWLVNKILGAKSEISGATVRVHGIGFKPRSRT